MSLGIFEADFGFHLPLPLEWEYDATYEAQIIDARDRTN